MFNNIDDTPVNNPLAPPMLSKKLSTNFKTSAIPFVISIKKSSFNKSVYNASAAALTLLLAPSQLSAYTSAYS